MIWNCLAYGKSRKGWEFVDDAEIKADDGNAFSKRSLGHLLTLNALMFTQSLSQHSGICVGGEICINISAAHIHHRAGNGLSLSRILVSVSVEKIARKLKLPKVLGTHTWTFFPLLLLRQTIKRFEWNSTKVSSAETDCTSIQRNFSTPPNENRYCEWINVERRMWMKVQLAQFPDKNIYKRS